MHNTSLSGESSVPHGPVETKTPDRVQGEPYALPANFKWVECDVEDAKEARARSCPISQPEAVAQMDDVYNLLSENYVEDSEGVFRFDYSREFLSWCVHVVHCTRHKDGSRAGRQGAPASGLPAPTPRWCSRHDKQ